MWSKAATVVFVWLWLFSKTQCINCIKISVLWCCWLGERRGIWSIKLLFQQSPALAMWPAIKGTTTFQKLGMSIFFHVPINIQLKWLSPQWPSYSWGYREYCKLKSEPQWKSNLVLFSLIWWHWFYSFSSELIDHSVPVCIFLIVFWCFCSPLIFWVSDTPTWIILG